MKSPKVIPVMIVTDHPIMQEGLHRRVEQEADMEVICEASGSMDALLAFLRCNPEVALIDLQWPRGAALKLMNAIRALRPSTPLVILTSYPGEIDTSPRSYEGPTRAVSRSSVDEEVIAAIHAVVGR